MYCVHDGVISTLKLENTQAEMEANLNLINILQNVICPFVGHSEGNYPLNSQTVAIHGTKFLQCTLLYIQISVKTEYVLL